MRIGIVVDSACDLPKSFFDANQVEILPISVLIDGQETSDTRDPQQTLAFYQQHQGDKAHSAQTAPHSVEQIKQVFLKRLVLDYDYVFCLTLMRSRSPIFEHATRASFGILAEYKAVRQKAGVSGPFALRVIDTQNLFAAQGITAVEANRLIRAGAGVNEIRERLESLANKTYGYMLPRDLYHLRARAKTKGDKSVGWLQYTLGSALDIKPLVRGFRGETGPVAKLRHFEDGAQRLFAYAGERIKRGLLTPTLCLSYGGDLSKLEALPGYAELERIAQTNGVEIYTSLMSMTGVVNVGEGALAMGFAAPEHELKL